MALSPLLYMCHSLIGDLLIKTRWWHSPPPPHTHTHNCDYTYLCVCNMDTLLFSASQHAGLPYTLAKLAICYCIIHFAYGSLGLNSQFIAIFSYTPCFWGHHWSVISLRNGYEILQASGSPDIACIKLMFLVGGTLGTMLQVLWYVLINMTLNLKLFSQ